MLAALAAMLLLAGYACLVRFAARAADRTHSLPIHTVDLARLVGCGIAMSFLLCLCMMSFVSMPHLLSEALRPDADPGWPIRRDRLARLDCRRIFLSGRERTLESSPITVAAFFGTGNLDMA